MCVCVRMGIPEQVPLAQYAEDNHTSGIKARISTDEKDHLLPPSPRAVPTQAKSFYTRSGRSLWVWSTRASLFCLPGSHAPLS